MTELESIISALYVTSVVKVEDLTEDFSLDGMPFRLFLEPKSTSDVKVGDIMLVIGTLPYGGEVKAPVVVGKWSEVIFETITAMAIDLTEMNGVYVAPIKYYKQ